jgi:hypothetical protein
MFQWVELIALVIGLTLAGFGAGWARIRWRAAPVAASALVVGVYAIAMIAATICAASCPKCNSGELHRIDAVAWSAIIYGGLAIVIVLAIWVGAAFTRVLTRLFGHGPSA